MTYSLKNCRVRVGKGGPEGDFNLFLLYKKNKKVYRKTYEIKRE
jgi:hypothetical protein